MMHYTPSVVARKLIYSGSQNFGNLLIRLCIAAFVQPMKLLYHGLGPCKQSKCNSPLHFTVAEILHRLVGRDLLLFLEVSNEGA
jgi:hypothetical protein